MDSSQITDGDKETHKSYSLKKNNLEKIISEYRITQSNFNPDKNSPPNLFISKLEIRMKQYYNNINKSNNKKQ